jgi:hypothetical protein
MSAQRTRSESDTAWDSPALAEVCNDQHLGGISRRELHQSRSGRAVQRTCECARTIVGGRRRALAQRGRLCTRRCFQKMEMADDNTGMQSMSLRTLLIILLVLLLIGALPAWPYSAGWGYYPSGGLGIILLILIVVALLR